MRYVLIKSEDCTSTSCSQRNRKVGEEVIRTDFFEIAVDINKAFKAAQNYNDPNINPCKCRCIVGMKQ